MSSLNSAGGRSMIWESELDEKQARRAAGLKARIDAPQGLAGEWVSLRFKSASGGCEVEGALLSAELSAQDGTQELDIHLAGDKWRVW